MTLRLFSSLLQYLELLVWIAHSRPTRPSHVKARTTGELASLVCMYNMALGTCILLSVRLMCKAEFDSRLSLKQSYSDDSWRPLGPILVLT